MKKQTPFLNRLQNAAGNFINNNFDEIVYVATIVLFIILTQFMGGI